MTVKGLIGIALLALTAIIVAMIMTGPRANYWRGMFETSAYPEAAGRITQRGPDGKIHVYVRQDLQPRYVDVKRPPTWRESVIGRAEDRFEMDRTQLHIELVAEAEGADAAMRDLSERRERLEAALAATGHAGATINELDIRTEAVGREPPLQRARVMLAVTFDRNLDVVELLSDPRFSGIGALRDTFFWRTDLDKAVAEVRERALARAEQEASRIAEGRTWRVLNISYEDVPRNLSNKWKLRTIRVSVVARIQIEGEGLREARIEP